MVKAILYDLRNKFRAVQVDNGLITLKDRRQAAVQQKNGL